jgi:SAM-dependent methyltransferase
VLERRVIEPDARGIADFYGTPAGQIARRAILAKLKGIWPGLFGLRLLGFGFAIPYLGAFGAERAIAAGPAAMGVTRWPPGQAASLLCDEGELPFADALFDRVLLVHGLERAEALRPLLRQLWRVLAPEGKLLVVAPNRASLWAQVDSTPFGQGRPFSKSELERILREALFEPERWERTLYAPPLATRWLASNGAGWERIGSLLFPALGGVHVVEAKKSIYAMTPLPVETAAASVPTPLLSPETFRSSSAKR